MATNYTNTSPYFDTPVINNQYLGLMIERPIPKLVDDLSMTINETYNPNQLPDPLFDFVTGTTIYLPQKSTLQTVLGI